MQAGAPAHQIALLRLTPEPCGKGAQQQLLGQRHLRVWRHLEAAKFDQPQPARRAIGREQFVDADLGAMGIARHIHQQIAEQTVHQPWARLARIAGGHLRQRDFQFIEAVLAGLIDARGLTGRADEHAGKQIAERGMALPVEHEAFEQIGAADEGRVRKAGPTQHDMVAAARADRAAIDHEFICREATFARGGIERLGDVHRLFPTGGRLDIDLDHARVRRDLHHHEARVGWRRIALNPHRYRSRLGHRFYVGDDFEIVLQRLDRRDEHREMIAARLDGERGAHRALDDFLLLAGLLDVLAAGHTFVALGLWLGLWRRAEIGQFAARLGRVARVNIGIVGGRHIGQRAQRQPIAQRAIARHREERAAPHLPYLAFPARGLGGRGIPPLDRQDVAHGF